MSHRFIIILLAVALLSGCATVPVPIPRSDYQKISWPNTYTVRTKDGGSRVARWVEPNDSALVIVRPPYNMYDPSKYPVSIPYENIESIETTQRRSILHVETGAEWGENFGAESPEFDSWRGLIELGYVSGELDAVKPIFGYGGTVYLAPGPSDFRVGLKGMVRRRLNPSLSFDLFAGPMLTKWSKGPINGFVGGVSLNVSQVLTLQSEYTSFQIEPWRESVGGVPVDHPGGYEQVWYNGAAFSGTAGLTTLGVATGAMVIYTALLLVWLASYD